MMQAICRLSMCSVLLLSLVGQVSSQVIGSTCTATSECTDAGITNVECRDDGSGDQCLCATGYSASDATTCDAIVINGACTVLADCGGITGNVECRDDGGGYKCLCQTGYTAFDATTCSIVDCGSPAAPADGTVDASVTTYQSVATFSCDTGYTLQGSTTRTCQADSSWDNAQPTCQINDCGSLADPPNGVSDDSSGTTYNSVATFTCNDGYTMAGSGTSTCQADKNWDNTDPDCQINDCGNLGNPPNGVADNSGGTTYLSLATFTCDTGYTLSGSATSTCQANKQWDNTDPQCTINDCGTLTAPANGDVTYSNNGATTYGETATFTCDLGYDLTGTTTRTCEADGNWGGASPICVIKVIGSSCTAASDCTSAGITNVECRDDGSGDQCLCVTGYNASDATTCDAIVQNADCSSGTACGDTTNYVCDTTTDTCEVKADGVKTDCANTDGNCPAHASCATTVCNCDAGWTHASGLCTAIVGYSCSVDSECTALDSNTECSSGSCACVSGYTNAAGGACLASDGLKLTASGFGVYLSILLMSIFL